MAIIIIILIIIHILIIIMIILLIINIMTMIVNHNTDNTVSVHTFKSQNFKSSVSNPKNKYVAYSSVLSQISNCQGLGRKNKHEILKTDRMLNYYYHYHYYCCYYYQISLIWGLAILTTAYTECPLPIHAPPESSSFAPVNSSPKAVKPANVTLN